MFKGVIGSIDFDKLGCSSGSVSVPHSVDRSPYYQIQIPYWRLNTGNGPSVLLLGANHGDEYEGPIVLTKFLQAVRCHVVGFQSCVEVGFGGRDVPDRLEQAAVVEPVDPFQRRETMKQSDLALMLSQGRTLAESALELGIAEKTARRHLEAIYAKTGLGRPIDLVRLVLSMPGRPLD